MNCQEKRERVQKQGSLNPVNSFFCVIWFSAISCRVLDGNSLVLRARTHTVTAHSLLSANSFRVGPLTSLSPDVLIWGVLWAKHTSHKIYFLTQLHMSFVCMVMKVEKGKSCSEVALLAGFTVHVSLHACKTKLGLQYAMNGRKFQPHTRFQGMYHEPAERLCVYLCVCLWSSFCVEDRYKSAEASWWQRSFNLELSDSKHQRD